MHGEPDTNITPHVMRFIHQLQFFGQREGCLDRNCPFSHDSKAALDDRANVLEQRRSRFNYKHCPPEHQYRARYRGLLDHLSGGDKGIREQFSNSPELRRDLEMDRAYCANPQCMKPWKKGEKNPLKACKGCKYTMYCSVSVLGSMYSKSYTFIAVRMPKA
jgi:hypothetical protein